MAAEDRKLAQGTAIVTANLPTAMLYGEPAGGSPPWGNLTGSQLMGNMYSGGTIYPVGSVAVSQLLGINSGGTIVGVPNTGFTYVQDATPSSPSADETWYETDTNIVWVYGTFAGASRWVSLNLYSSGVLSRANASAAQAQQAANIQSGQYDLYIQSLFVRALVQTTNDGSNHWKFDLRKVSGTTLPTTGLGSSLGSVTTGAMTLGTWGEASVSIDAVIDNVGAGIEVPFVDITKVGSAGNDYSMTWIVYRLIHP